MMTYTITTTVPEVSCEQLKQDAAQRVYEELLRYISSINESDE